MAKRRQKRLPLVFSWPRLVICLVLIALLAGGYFVFTWWQQKEQPANNNPAIVFHTVDVGQGDCILVEFPDQKVMMVDTGKSSAYSAIIDYLQKCRITTIDWLVITHPDDDHFGSAPKLLANDELTFVTKYCENSLYEKDLASYQNLITDYDFQPPVDQLVIDTGAGYVITFVSPLATDEIKKSNDASLMMTITYGNKIFVLTGDASETVEPLFIERATALGIFDDVANKQVILKVGHHGSSTSSSTAFLDFIFNPLDTNNNFALISCGQNNSYHHPHEATLTRLSAYCASDNILITKDCGDIVVRAGVDTLTINGQDYHFAYLELVITLGVVIVVLCFFNYRGKKKEK